MSNQQNQNEEPINILKLMISNSALESELKELKDHNHKILDSWKKTLSELQSCRQSNAKHENLITELKEKLEISKSEDIIKSIRDLKEHIRDIELYKTEFYNLANQKDYVYVSQFDKLLWGDNYPSLKVFFNYLQKMNTLTINRSYFASKMDYGNMKPINLNTNVLAKQDLGYLLAKIKPFFLDEFTGKPSRYHAIIERKFTIDGNSLDHSFFKKYLRQYNSGKIPDNLKMAEIDKIALDILDKHH